jgi:hypothetical protein
MSGIIGKTKTRGSGVIATDSYIQSDITATGTVASGTWQGTAVADEYGGTGQSSYAQGDILYASSANVLAKLTKGSDNHVLTMDGNVPNWESASSPTLNGKTLVSVNSYASAGSPTWERPPNVTDVLVYVTGGGGGGGAKTAGSARLGGAGAGGGTAILFVSSVASSVTVTVGAAGAAGDGSGAGGAGGTSSFGSHCTATGGGGGNNDGSATAAHGGIGADGNANLTGGGGGGNANGNSFSMSAYGGGDSFWGGGAEAKMELDGEDGTTGGGGSAGGHSGSTTRDGGAGGIGFVLVFNYAST